MYSSRKSFIIKCTVVVCIMFSCILFLTNNDTPEVIRQLQPYEWNPNPLVVEPVKPVLPVVELTGVHRLVVLDRVKEMTKCLDRPMLPKVQQRGDYWVLYNYVMAHKRFKCHESITYTTHTDYSFMDNLLPLLKRWRGPVSVALYAPGADFKKALDSIAYLRDCTDSMVKDYVTFHVYFNGGHVPKKVPRHNKVFTKSYNCSLPAPFLNVNRDQMYKSQNELQYPINVGRNVAREMAQTHYILPSDIELYPSPNIIPQFLEMIANSSVLLLSKNPKVLPLHLFEVSANQTVPDSKIRLKEMLADGTAIRFHKNLCPDCHSLPKATEWENAKAASELRVFNVAKRFGKFKHWEPIFIGTHADPLYDERLSWESRRDKGTQGFALCVLDYDFLILNNAFLVHRPGIKIYKADQKKTQLRTDELIDKIILPELKALYGRKNGCAV